MRDDQLHAFLGEARARAASQARRRRRWLARQLDEDRSFADVCHRAIDDRVDVDVLLTSGRTYRGRVVDVGADMLVVATSDSGFVFVASCAVTGVRRWSGSSGTAPRSSPPSRIDPCPTTATTVDEVLRQLVDRRGVVEVGTTSGALHRGRLAGVGRDVLWFTDGLHLRVAAVAEVIPVR